MSLCPVKKGSSCYGVAAGKVQELELGSGFRSSKEAADIPGQLTGFNLFYYFQVRNVTQALKTLQCFVT